MQWTIEAIRALVPEATILNDGRRLADKDTHWKSSGQNDSAIWALVQGSGKLPYKTCMTPDGSASRCSCPSRKFPCKHAAGLMFRLAANKVPTEADTPDWVQAWINGRKPKAAKAQAPVSEADAKRKAASQAKRQTARDSKVTRGVETLRLHLEDTIRRGLSDPQIKTYPYWDKIAAQMVDAQMTPIARRLRELGGRPFQGRSDWSSRLTGEIAQIYALTEAYTKLDSLPESLRYDVRLAIGYDMKQPEVLEAGDSLRDEWRVISTHKGWVDQLMERRVWLYGINSKRYALILDFTPQNVSFPVNYITGTSIFTTITFYPGAYPLRGIITSETVNRSAISRETDPLSDLYPDVETALSGYAQALSINPFLGRFPIGMEGATFSSSSILDHKGAILSAQHPGNPLWRKAVVGGTPAQIFGEWDGYQFILHAVNSMDGWADESKP